MVRTYVTIGSIALTVVMLLWMLSRGGKQSVLRPKCDLARMAVQLAAALLVPMAAGVATSSAVAFGAGFCGGAIGIVQGRNLRVSRNGSEVVASRNRMGLVVWATGIVTMQAAGLANRVGLLEIGQAVSWGSIGVGIGLLLARQGLVRDATRQASFAGLAFAVLGLPGPLAGHIALPGGGANPVLAQFEADERDATEIELGTGGIQVTLSWNGDADMDLHVIDTVGFEIFFDSLRSPQTGGELDEDDRPDCGEPAQEVENVFWAPAMTPAGEYVAFVRSYRGCDDRSQAYVLEVRIDDVLVARDHGSLLSGQDSIQVSFRVSSNGSATELEEIGGGEGLDTAPEDVTGTGTYVTPVGPEGQVADADGTISEDEALASALAGLIAAAMAGVITWAEAVAGANQLLGASGRAPQGEALIADSLALGGLGWEGDGLQTSPMPLTPPPPSVPPQPGPVQPAQESRPSDQVIVIDGSTGAPPGYVWDPLRGIWRSPADIEAERTQSAVPQAAASQAPAQPPPAQPVPPSAPSAPVHPRADRVEGPTSTPARPQYERRTKDELWKTAQQKLNSNGNSHTMDSSELIEYLRRLEAEFPTATPQQLIAALHASEYATDTDRTVPGFDGTIPGLYWPLFKHGAETDGYKAIYERLEAGNGHGATFTLAAPKFVVGPDGEPVDIDHVWAGLRSDLNREPGDFAQLMKLMNTDWGDEWQTWMHWDEGKAPPPQRKGNWIGRVMALDRQGSNRNRPLSEAFTEWFNYSD